MTDAGTLFDSEASGGDPLSHPHAHDVFMRDADVVAVVAGLDAADIAVADSAGCAELLRLAKRTRGWLDAVEARITSRMSELYRTAGAAPAADEHGRHSGVSAAEGKRRERRSKAIEEAASFGEALAAGAIGAEHVDALANATCKLGDEVKSELLANQDELVAEACAMSPEEFARACRDRVRRLERDHGVDRNRQQRHDTFLSRRKNRRTGMVEGRFAFHPELANQIFGAIDQQAAAMVAAGEARGEVEFVERSYDPNRLAAEALGELIAGGHQRRRPNVADITMICDHDTAFTGELHDGSICETADGLPVPPASIARLMCQGRITPVIVDTTGVVLNVGRDYRHATPAQRRALRAMYRHCGFPGCDVEFDHCEIHHLLPWELDGPTDLANLIPLCSRHHHVVHEGGWTLDLDDERTLTVTRPDGVVHASVRPDIADDRTGARRRRTAA